MALMAIRPRQNLGSADTTRLLSPNIWFDCPINAMKAGEIDGFDDGDDFEFMDTEDAVDTGGYQKYIDSGNTIRLAATSTTLYGGNIQLVTDATDNDAPIIQRHGANAGSTGIGPYILGNSSGATFPLWFECRIKRASISDDITAFAIGLGQVGMVADNGLLEDDTGDIVDSVSFIGFRSKHKNGGTTGQNAAIDFVYQDSAQTAPTVTLAAAATGVADTFIKLGFKYTPQSDSSHKIRLYVNNLELGTYITTTNIDAATFPENDPLAFVCGIKNGGSSASTFTMDWWHCTQSYGG